jgi:pyrimidine-nucleoside phosphorylase
MIELGRRAERETVCVLTDMDQPIGYAVGNALEIHEAVDTLRGEGPQDFAELVLESAAQLLALSDLDVDEAEGRRRAEQAVADGSAHSSYERWIQAQGGTPDLEGLPVAPVVREVVAPADGIVTALGAVNVGLAALRLGAGRRAKEDQIDHAVGVICRRKRGDTVCSGDVLAEVHARDDTSAESAAADVLDAYTLGEAPPAAGPIVLEVLS